MAYCIGEAVLCEYHFFLFNRMVLFFKRLIKTRKSFVVSLFFVSCLVLNSVYILTVGVGVIVALDHTE
jgi:hypothetical protein